MTIQKLDKLVLYFVLVVGIIGVVVLTLFFVQLMKILEESTQTQLQLNETSIFLHEDGARKIQDENNRKFEQSGRDNQSQKSREMLIEMKTELKDFYATSISNQEKILQRIEYGIEGNGNISKDVLNISREHQKVGLDHNRIQQNISKDLYEYGENSIVKFESLEKKLDLLLNQSN